MLKIIEDYNKHRVVVLSGVLLSGVVLYCVVFWCVLLCLLVLCCVNVVSFWDTFLASFLVYFGQHFVSRLRAWCNFLHNFGNLWCPSCI